MACIGARPLLGYQESSYNERIYLILSEYDESEMNRDLGNYPILGYYDDNKFVEWKE